MSGVIDVWCGQCPILLIVWWVSGVVNVWYCGCPFLPNVWWMSVWWMSYNHIKSHDFISQLILRKELGNLHVHCFSWSCSVVDCRSSLDFPFNQQFKLVGRIWGRVMQPN